MERDLKSEVVARWSKAARPSWTAARTLAVAEEVDDDFAATGMNPAPRFREERGNRNAPYLDTWIGGCHFDWLNPRQEGREASAVEHRKPSDPATLLSAVAEALGHVDAACQILNGVDLPVIENEAHDLRLRLEELCRVLGGSESRHSSQ